MKKDSRQHNHTSVSRQVQVNHRALAIMSGVLRKKVLRYADISSGFTLRVNRGALGELVLEIIPFRAAFNDLSRGFNLSAVKHNGGTLIFRWGGPLRVAGGGWETPLYIRDL